MKIKLIILAIFSLPLICQADRSPATFYQLKTDLQKTSTRNLSSLLSDFVSASLPSRMVGLPGHEKAKNFIVEKINEYDKKKSGKLTVSNELPDVESIKAFYQNDFNQKVEGKIPKTSSDYQKWSRFTASMQKFAASKKDIPVENIVWEKGGLNPKKVLIVTAHYDTISHDKNSLLVAESTAMPGANYNASGVVIALSLLRTLAAFDLNYSVKVVFLDWQGIGFYGSKLYAQELKKLQDNGTEIMGIVNLEMLGQDTTYFDKDKKNGNMGLYLRDNPSELEFAKSLTNHGQKMKTKVEFEIKPTNFESSDNVRFNEQGLKAVTFSQNWESDFNPKFYQTPQDTPETLNHKTLYHAYQYVGGAVIGTLLDLTK